MPITPSSEVRGFEDIKQLDESGQEFWSARDLMPLFGYDTWENFEAAIKRAKTSLETNKVPANVVFRDATKTQISRNQSKSFEISKPDYHIVRFGCYLVAQNGDPRKPQIAQAQAYFTIQTLRQEEYDRLPEVEKRLFIREQVQQNNKKLNQAAGEHGVTNFAFFHNAGYRGLYGMNMNALRTFKGIGSDNLIDRAGSTELAANLFRITQTEERLHKDLAVGHRRGQRGSQLVHEQVGNEVRQAIINIGGTMPEDLPAEEHIKEIEKKMKKKQITRTEVPLFESPDGLEKE